ncbi:hypothetical protein [Devosia sp. 919]|uniref:hypothetical protein n=1 Tax=Devosia sp. 919 TaxID=2726065 RepID=UPI0015527A77|nr:hypothetical protein [Devosia sp. 919]
MSYDLFKVPDGYETDLALVVAPYFDKRFAKKIAKQLQANRLRYLLDESARDEEVSSLITAFQSKDFKICLCRAAGIAHLKLFYLEFVKSAGNRTRKRRLIFGSGNATEAAFGGKRNAELFANVDLGAAGDKPLLSYIREVLGAIEAGGGVVNALRYPRSENAPQLLLPKLRVVSTGAAPGFDAWLQKGQLAAKYREAQNFLTASVFLKKALPQDLVAQQFAGRGLIQAGQRNVVKYAYVGQLPSETGDSDDDEAVAQWKAQFTVWTHFGDWVSEECFQEHGRNMRSRSAPLRRSRIDELLENGTSSAWVEQKTEEFLYVLRGAWSDLEANGASPSDYLHGKRGELADKYSGKFRDKIRDDLLRANDKDFYQRFVGGYEFPKVPKFREDAAAWTDFVRTWCESLIVESGKRSSRSLLMQTVRLALSELDINFAELTTDGISKSLRENWGEKVFLPERAGVTLGEVVAGYYQPVNAGAI